MTSKLRHDAERVDGSAALTVPAWLHESLDIADVLKDLRRVGGKDLQHCFGDAVSDKDAAFRMLETKFGFGPESFPSEVAETGCDPAAVFWYAAWMRGLSQARLGSVNARLFGILGALLPPPVQAQSAGDRQGTFFVQKDAKSFAQVCERVLAEIEEIHGELLTEQIGEDDAQRLMRDAPAFVSDYISVTFIANDAAGIYKAFKLLQASPGGVVAVNNMYHNGADSVDGYRDLKLYVPVKTDKHGPLVVEVKLLLAGTYWETYWLSLPTDYFNGAFDYMKPQAPEEKTQVPLPRHLVPQPKLFIPNGADEETKRKMLELMERINKKKEEVDKWNQKKQAEG